MRFRFCYCHCFWNRIKFQLLIASNEHWTPGTLFHTIPFDICQAKDKMSRGPTLSCSSLDSGPVCPRSSLRCLGTPAFLAVAAFWHPCRLLNRIVLDSLESTPVRSGSLEVFCGWWWRGTSSFIPVWGGRLVFSSGSNMRGLPSPPLSLRIRTVSLAISSDGETSTRVSFASAFEITGMELWPSPSAFSTSFTPLASVLFTYMSCICSSLSLKPALAFFWYWKKEAVSVKSVLAADPGAKV